MQVSPEITFNGVDRSEYNEQYIRERIARLNRMSDEIISCRIVVERPHRPRQTGNVYRVRVDLTLPGRSELVVEREEQMEPQMTLRTVIGHAFDVMERRLRAQIPGKHHQNNRMAPEVVEGEPLHGMVVRLFKDDGYGFIKTEDGREFYMHRNSVLHDDFDRLADGTEVSFTPELGEKGPQATSVQVVSKMGENIDDDEPEGFEPPLGWESENG